MKGSVNVASQCRDLIDKIKAGEFSPIYLLMGDEPYYLDMLSDALIENALDEFSRDFNETICYGADVDAAKEITESKESLRVKYGFSPSDIIIVHGGKLDPRKGTVDLIEVYRQLRGQGHENLRLVLFGKMVDQRIKQILDKDIVVYDWLSRTETFELFKLADLAVWPIHHTTLIEDCVASNLPYLIRKTETTKHLINSDFYLENGEKEELSNKIKQFIQEEGRTNCIKNVSEMQEKISYYSIANNIFNL